MQENIVINFETQGLTSTVTQLEKLGVVTEADAKAFNQAGTAAKGFGDTIQQGATKSNDAINKTTKNVSGLEKQIHELGKTIVAAFAVEKIIEFGKESFLAFAQAEQNAKKLQTAVSVNGGLAHDFEKLIDQAETLGKKTIFSHDNIMQAQTLGLQAQLTSKQIEHLIPIITDFASATGQDLNSALESVLRGLEGQGRGLKLYGIQVDSSADKAHNLEAIERQLNDRFKGQSEIIAGTQLGQLKKLGNAYEEIKESVGGALSKMLEISSEAVLSTFDPAKFIQMQAEKGIAKANEYSEKLKNIREESFGKSAEELSTKQLEDRLRGANLLQEKYIKEGNKQKAELQLENIQAINAQLRKRELELVQQTSTITTAQLKELAAKGYQEAKDELEKRAKLGEQEQKKLEERLRKEQELRNKQAEFIRQQDAKEFKMAEDFREQFTATQIAELAKQNLTEEEFKKKSEEIERQDLNLKLQNYKDYKQDYGAILKQIADLDLKQAEDRSKTKIHPNADDFKEVIKDNEKYAKRVLEIEKELAKKRKEIYIEIGQTIINGLFDIAQAQSEIDINQINAERDARDKSTDEEIKKLEEKHNKKHISDKQYQKQLDALNKQKETNDKVALKKENEIKHQQDIANRERKLFDIAITTARNIVEFPLLTALYLALGAAEAGIVLATPLPKYHTGKRAKHDSGEHMAIVRNDEDIFSPKTSKDYAPTFKAIHDGKIKPNLLNDFVSFQLKGGSANVNNSVEIDYKKLAGEIAWSLRGDKTTNLSDGTINKLASIIEQSSDPRRN